MCEVPVA
jgi:hypothetical protein